MKINKDGIHYMNHSNRDVPPETIIRHMTVEKGRLQAEIQHLKEQLCNRDNAIKAFKEWQKKVAEYNVEYWVTEGVKFLDEKPNPEILRLVRRITAKNKAFQELEVKVVKTYHSVVNANFELYEILNESDIKETAQVIFPIKLTKLPTGKMLDLNDDVRKAWLEGVEFGRERLNRKKDD